MKVLVTGGAGYIGSHVVRSLAERGYDIVVYDDLSTGSRDAVLAGRLVIGDLSDRKALHGLFAQEGFDAVMHFAASVSVEESIRNPLQYYRNNFANSLNLIDACTGGSVNIFIFSSTAAVYGKAVSNPVREDVIPSPLNPYGASKLMVEKVLGDVSGASDLRYVALRYFNVAGADRNARIGQRCRDATNLMTLALRTALGMRGCLEIYGTDYDTADGTCIRDYIHVDDLVDAHLLALDHLSAGGMNRIYNCGYGRGYSVREVIDMVKKIAGSDFRVEETGRREGDPPALIADSALIRTELGWKPAHDDLEFIVRTAWEWEKKLQAVRAK